MSGTINFPSNPTVGQLYTFNNTTWVWNGTVWANANVGSNFLPLNPWQNIIPGLIPQNYVDNSGFIVNQRAYVSGAALGANAYGFDRWRAGASCTLSFTNTPASTIVNITAGELVQIVEGANILGATYTLSWTGTAQGNLSNTTTVGAFAPSPIQWTAEAGTDLQIVFQGGTLGQVQLQLGSQATPWQPQPAALELQRCLRFYWPFSFSLQAYMLGGQAAAAAFTFPAVMRVAPSVTILDLQSNVNAAPGSNVFVIGAGQYQVNVVATATGLVNFIGTAEVSADL